MKATTTAAALVGPRGAGAAPPAFDFQPLTRVVFGAGTTARLGELVREYGGRTRPPRHRSGAGGGRPPAAGPGLAPRRRTHCLCFRRRRGQSRPAGTSRPASRWRGTTQIDFLVAVGGGSSMDCAKGINFLLTNGGRMADYKGFGKATRPMLPSIGRADHRRHRQRRRNPSPSSPTSATHMKMACGDRKAAFRVAILDPEVTVSQPAKVTAVTGIDALSHALESYVTTRRNPLAQTFAREAWRLMEPNLAVVLRDPGQPGGARCDADRRALRRRRHRELHARRRSRPGEPADGPLRHHAWRRHRPRAAARGSLQRCQAVGPLYADLAHEAGLVNGDSKGGRRGHRPAHHAI